MTHEAVVEVIPDDNFVARHVNAPFMWDAKTQALIAQNLFLLNSGAESLVWRKYAATPAEVHLLGCARQSSLRDRGNAGFRYQGFYSASAGDVRALKNAVGDGFAVDHVPSEGIHHAHVSFRQAGADTLRKAHRAELRHMLAQHFSGSGLESHECHA